MRRITDQSWDDDFDLVFHSLLIFELKIPKKRQSSEARSTRQDRDPDGRMSIHEHPEYVYIVDVYRVVPVGRSESIFDIDDMIILFQIV